MKKYENYINKLTSYLYNTYETTTIFDYGANNEYDPWENEIYIDTKLKSKSKLFTLLHEAGHTIVRMKGKREFNKRYPDVGKRLQPNTPDYYKPNKREYIDTIREEYDAWDEGLKLSQELNFRISKKDYNNYSKLWLWSYIKTAVDNVRT